ncbi:MAG: GNAT family N-acetyltransferase [Pseudomonadota bacterium]
MEVRRLDATDLTAFRELRLEGLKLYPGAFGSSYEDSVKLPDLHFLGRIESSHMLGGFVDGELEGCLCLAPETGQKVCHRGSIYAVYVRKAWQGSGLAKMMMEAAVDLAPGLGLRQIELFVSSSNPRALSFYRKMGFEQVGTVPDALRVDGVFYDEHYMVRHLGA